MSYGYGEKKPEKQYDVKKLAYIELVEKQYPRERDCHMTSDNFWNCEEIRDSVTRVVDARATLAAETVKCKEKSESWGELFRASVFQECVDKEEVKFGKVLDPAYATMNQYKAFERLSWHEKHKKGID